MYATTNRWLWAALALAVIWLCAAAVAIWSPSLVTGFAHEQFPLLPITVPIWALLSTGFVVMAPALTRDDRPRVWRVYAGAVSAIWLAAAAVAIAAPSLVTGTDPTTVPLAGLLAPIVAMAATAYATVAVVAIAAREETLGGAVDSVVRRFTEGAPGIT